MIKKKRKKKGNENDLENYSISPAHCPFPIFLRVLPNLDLRGKDVQGRTARWTCSSCLRQRASVHLAREQILHVFAPFLPQNVSSLYTSELVIVYSSVDKSKSVFNYRSTRRSINYFTREKNLAKVAKAVAFFAATIFFFFFFSPFLLSWNVYLAFKVFRRLLLNMLRLTHRKGYTEISSKLSMLGSRVRGQKNCDFSLKTSAATINFEGVRARETCRIPRPFLVVSANGDSTRITSEKSEYSEANNFLILFWSTSGFLVRWRDLILHVWCIESDFCSYREKKKKKNDTRFDTRPVNFFLTRPSICTTNSLARG